MGKTWTREEPGRTMPAVSGPGPGHRRSRLRPLAMAGVLAAMILAVAVPAVGWDEQAKAPVQSAAGFQPPWSWPLSPEPAVLSTFQAPAQRWLAGHRGVDLEALPGAPVLSPASGTVVFAGWVVNRPVLTVDLGGGLLASFEPVHAEKMAGDSVAEGEVLGHLADPASAVPGHCAASCLHWGVRLNQEYVNPLNYVTDRRPSVLLPLR
ncbi:M23 family metallopeptidase [Arthrobacter sp. zg-Y1219]|uniref:murein hydrolase activator EnvC family protein n=1 Tax=Arthrobacter sp. zg-Y1219 TaxID=3049067 RepID=UPI0024C21E57|nr:M23 family metallopeptidase [Arthrobacter sp. zg-Y1219]MDK1360302.1 M23 family metallopeptidase [Arthrobacter sp. zg-Y1219]